MTSTSSDRGRVPTGLIAYGLLAPDIIAQTARVRMAPMGCLLPCLPLWSGTPSNASLKVMASVTLLYFDLDCTLSQKMKNPGPVTIGRSRLRNGMAIIAYQCLNHSSRVQHPLARTAFASQQA